MYCIFSIDFSVVENGFVGVLHFILGLNTKIEESNLFKIHLIMKGNFVGSKENLSLDDFKGIHNEMVNRFLFYFRDQTFECIAETYSYRVIRA